MARPDSRRYINLWDYITIYDNWKGGSVFNRSQNTYWLPRLLLGSQFTNIICPFLLVSREGKTGTWRFCVKTPLPTYLAKEISVKFTITGAMHNRPLFYRCNALPGHVSHIDYLPNPNSDIIKISERNIKAALGQNKDLVGRDIAIQRIRVELALSHDLIKILEECGPPFSSVQDVDNICA